MKQGLYYNIPESDYHASDALSNSGMKTILSKSPRHYQHEYLLGNKKEKPALAFGQAFHAAILEHEKYTTDYVVAPDLNKNTNAYKAWKTAQTGAIISADDAQMIADMRSAIVNKPAALALLQMEGKNEVSLFCEHDGIMLRARMDRLLDAHIGIDIKTCQDASPEGFKRHAYDYCYHMQAYFYSWMYKQVTGHDMQDFVFICIEKNAPYCVGLYRASQEMLELGKVDVEKAITIYKQAKERGEWFDYDDCIIPLGLPRYAENRLTYGD